MRLLLLLLLIPILSAQSKLTFSSRDYKTGSSWTISACPTGPSLIAIPTGRIYQILVEHGIDHDDYDQAIVDIDAKEAKSYPAIMAKWSGYVVAGLAFAMTVQAIKASPQLLAGTTAASGALNVVIPIAQGARYTGQVDAIKRRLLRDTDILQAQPGSCAVGMVIGARGKSFEVTEPR